MTRLAGLLTALAALWNCTGDETVSGYGAAGTTWRLVELDGARFPARATLTFPEEGRIAGDGPCNAFTADQTAPYPWFDAERIAATRRACPDLDAEAAFFSALEAMTLAEVAGDVLILSNDTGRQMVFNAAAPD